jgi:transcription factor TGA
VSHFDPLTEQQVIEVHNLRQSCMQAEDALTQGVDKLQENLAKIVAETYPPQMGTAVEKLEDLVCFVIEVHTLLLQILTLNVTDICVALSLSLSLSLS